MNLKWDGIERRKTLRRKAEALVSSLSPEEVKAKPAEVLVHELLVHKIELEMQNEELRNTHNALQEAHDRYLDLYEFAPVGYITVNRDDQISTINLTGSALLGVERDKLIGQRFSKFVAPQDCDRWFRSLVGIMESDTHEKRVIGLMMKRADGSEFYVHLDCLRRESSDEPPTLRIALSDISHSRQTEK
ncbi:PAS domain-containing protein [Methylomonas koyamae]|uniref:PAS domain-containing protein n=1 Tax=Methylomonas koyamae TaxID=702114 RepID=UPI000BC32311|nr:PAS domain-containing protein [Methylomonas koyamae]ATG90115.1 Signal transduction histidine kinase [Methylomonas koyamae]